MGYERKKLARAAPLVASQPRHKYFLSYYSQSPSIRIFGILSWHLRFWAETRILRPQLRQYPYFGSNQSKSEGAILSKLTSKCLQMITKSRIRWCSLRNTPMKLLVPFWSQLALIYCLNRTHWKCLPNKDIHGWDLRFCLLIRILRPQVQNQYPYNIRWGLTVHVHVHLHVYIY